jgi:hypothetical protein
MLSWGHWNGKTINLNYAVQLRGSVTYFVPEEGLHGTSHLIRVIKDRVINLLSQKENLNSSLLPRGDIDTLSRRCWCGFPSR